MVVPFPFTDRQAAKRRPALIVSFARFNDAHEQAILAMTAAAAGVMLESSYSSPAGDESVFPRPSDVSESSIAAGELQSATAS